MSVDSTELQRATLERKKADELAIIATALGVKPGSRMKKADLVDLILSATTSSPRNGAPVAEPEAAPSPSLFDSPSAAQAREEAATARRAPAVPAPAPERPAPAEVSARAEADPAEASTTDPASTAAASTDVVSTDRATAYAGGANTASAEAPSADTAHVDAGRGEADGAEERNGDDARDDGRFDGEGGSRRRRRRGRDRDRPQGAERVDRPREEGRERSDDNASDAVAIAGYLDLRDEGYGFLRINGYFPSRDDAYVSVRQVRQFGLRKGDYVAGASRPAGHKEKNPALLRIDSVNGADPESARSRPRFEDLTPLFPDEKLRLERREDPYNMTARTIDLVSPIGKGQRGLIVSPPKAGKTTIMKQIARSIEKNNPEVHLIVLLVDERPEEVTDMRRWLEHGEVAASTFDRPAEEHIQVAELTIERAKRLVESGKDVCIILDGITRLARAYNLGAPATGRIMSGGIDAGALYPPKKFFGAARNVEEGGSLTILATALVETGSRMDEVIFEEFKGTGNMELRLDRRLAERRVYPAIDVEASSTRHEELLFDRQQLQQVWKLRRVLSAMSHEGDGAAAAALELLTDRLKTFLTNDEFLAEVAKGS